MAGVAYPAWYTLKATLKTFLQEVATAEKAVSAGRNFVVFIDRARPWVEKEHNTAMVVISVSEVNAKGNQTYANDEITVNLDLYALGSPQEQTVQGVTTVLPADEKAAARVDLLIAQVRHAISRLKNYNLGFAQGAVHRDQNLTVTYWSQENEEATGQYAPARISFVVHCPYIPADDGTTVALSEIDLTFQATLDEWAVKYTFGD